MIDPFAQHPLHLTLLGLNLLGLAQLLLVGLLLAMGLLVWMMFHRLRHPPRRGYAWAVAKGVPGDPAELPQPRAFEEISLTVDDRGQRCAAWSITGDDPNGPVIIYTPGWGDAKIKVMERLDAMVPIASTIIAWDPPGHGESPGRCWLGVKEPGMIRRIARECVPKGRGVILWGHSLGGGAAIVAGGDEEGTAHRAPGTSGGEEENGDQTSEEISSLVPGARCLVPLLIVAEAPYRLPKTPASRVMRQAGLPWSGIGPIAYLLLGLRTGAGPHWHGFDRAEHAARLRVPLLVIHGDADAICPLDDGRAIAQAAPQGELLIVEGGRHNDLWAAELGTSERVLAWLRSRSERNDEA